LQILIKTGKLRQTFSQTVLANIGKCIYYENTIDAYFHELFVWTQAKST